MSKTITFVLVPAVGAVTFRYWMSRRHDPEIFSRLKSSLTNMLDAADMISRTRQMIPNWRRTHMAGPMCLAQDDARQALLLLPRLVFGNPSLASDRLSTLSGRLLHAAMWLHDQERAMIAGEHE